MYSKKCQPADILTYINIIIERKYFTQNKMNLNIYFMMYKFTFL